jgi:hypothetical protein
VKAIFMSSSHDAHTNGHLELGHEARDAAAGVQELIDTPAPYGLVASARLIRQADTVLLIAETHREETARAYDRFDDHTRQATEALEILAAYCLLLERVDFALRTGVCRAA